MTDYKEPYDDVLDDIPELDDTDNKEGKKVKEKEEKIYKTSYIETDTTVLEQIYKPKDIKKHRYIMFNKSEFKFEEVDEMIIENRIYQPVDWEICEKGMILLPSDVKAYQEEKELDNRILKFIHKWLDVEEFYEILCLYYIKLTYVFDQISVVPYLRALGDYGSGKTRFIQTVGSLCYKPMFLAGASSDSFLFRIIETSPEMELNCITYTSLFSAYCPFVSLGYFTEQPTLLITK